MTLLQAIILGFVQGLSEFLPISSSAHLLLVRWVLGWPDPGIAFDVALHWGTLAGVLFYFRTDIAELFRSALVAVRALDAKKAPLVVLLLAGTIPAGLLGYIFEKPVEHYLRSPWVVVCTLSTFGLVLFAADRWGKKIGELQNLSFWKAVLIGGAQGLAVVPGVSRSGISVSMARIAGLNREAAVRFSFLLSVPLIFAAGIFEAPALIKNIADPILWAGVLTSGLSGYAAVRFLMAFVKTKSFTPFVVYRLVLAVLLAAQLLRLGGL